MKKVIFCNISMQEHITALVYTCDAQMIPHGATPVSYPILSYLQTNLKEHDEIKVVLLCKCDPLGRYQSNIAQFQKEMNCIIGNKNVSKEYIILDIEFEEKQSSSEKILSQIIDCCDSESQIIADITYGTKDLPIILVSALNFAGKHLNCDISRILYGKVYFQDGKPTNPRLCDMSYLLHFNSLIYALPSNSPEQSRETLKALLCI